ncbi:MAG: HD domain-containing phosphohydrolase [Bryobacteraceae bacterium]|jgi:diguanylate cyclase (GGDEF)-like protein/putative nucleotidyltransferase with HDIG domain
MSLIAKIYVSSIVVIGAMVTLVELARWQSQDLVRFVCYLALAIFASRLKVSLPGISGALSVLFIFILFAIVELSLPEALFIGCAAILMQCLWNYRQRPKWHQVLFNLGSMAMTVVTAGSVYHASLLTQSHLEPALRLVVTATVFFLMNTFPVAGAIALTERRTLRSVWRECYIWSFPYYLLGAVIAGAASALNRHFGWQTALLAIPVVYLIYRSYYLYLGRMEDEKKHAEEMAALHLRTIEALALAIEAKDHTTHDHLQRVQIYAVEVGKELCLDESQLEALRAAALLHDIGKLAVPEHIISKPGKLTREEFEKMKIHPIVGAEILERVRFPHPVTPIVRSHHERWDGTGYPDGLRGQSIPIGARILAAVDSLDALASHRQYRRALPLDEAMSKVAADSGKAFDPQVIEVLQRRYIELESMANSRQVETAKLSTDIKIERGLEPAAGFESNRRSPNAEPAENFLTSIAAARQEVQNLFELAQDLGNSLSLNETLSLLALRLKRMIPYDSLAIYVLRDDRLRAEYVNGENFRLFSSLEIPIGQGLSGWVAEKRKPIINGNPSVEPGYLDDETKFTTMRSALAVPLIGLNGTVSVLTLYHSERDAFTNDHLRILLAIVPKLALSIENALRFQQAESSASTDYMTGLPNARSLFLHLDGELARCRRLNSPLVVLVCDMNGFKKVNDKYGHLEGNRLLHSVAKKLKESCREYDYVARMGGDEFVLVLPGLQPDQLESKIERLKAITADAGREIFAQETLSLSIGHSMFPADGVDADRLLSEADRRMYIAKQKEKLSVVGAAPRGFAFEPTGTW